MNPRIQASRRKAHHPWLRLILTRQSTKCGAVWQQRLHWGMGTCACSPHWCLSMLCQTCSLHAMCLGMFPHTAAILSLVGWVPKSAQPLHFAEEHFPCCLSSCWVTPQLLKGSPGMAGLFSSPCSRWCLAPSNRYWRYAVVNICKIS